MLLFTSDSDASQLAPGAYEGFLPVTSPARSRVVSHGIACARLCLGTDLSQPCIGFALLRDTGPASGLVVCLLYDVITSPMNINTNYVTYIV